MRAIVAVALALGAAGDDTCAAHTNCKDCAGVNGCGWCSEAVIYADGTKGPQCASPSSSKAFTCSGLYSTDQCLVGYVCDQASGACRQGLPGQGKSKAECDITCTVGPVQKVYGCVNGTKTCVEVPAGTPGSGSRTQCTTSCWSPTATVYKCNGQTKKCEAVPVGTAGAASKEVCEAKGCDTGDWKCDPVSLKCSEGGGHKSEAKCNDDCREQNDPCENHYTCADCLAAGPECGWCSVNVTYANGRTGTQCAGVRKDILPFQCVGQYSTTACKPSTPTPAPAPAPTPAPGPSPLPPRVNCPKGSTVLLQYSCPDKTCDNCAFVHGQAKECLEPYCTYYCSGQCNPVPAFDTSFVWTCNNPSGGSGWTNATLVHYTKFSDCTGPVNPVGIGGSGTYPLDTCDGIGPNVPPQYNTFRCVPCGEACNWH